VHVAQHRVWADNDTGLKSKEPRLRNCTAQVLTLKHVRSQVSWPPETLGEGTGGHVPRTPHSRLSIPSLDRPLCGMASQTAHGPLDDTRTRPGQPEFSPADSNASTFAASAARELAATDEPVADAEKDVDEHGPLPDDSYTPDGVYWADLPLRKRVSLGDSPCTVSCSEPKISVQVYPSSRRRGI
jgi:hypothetical protein